MNPDDTIPAPPPSDMQGGRVESVPESTPVVVDHVSLYPQGIALHLDELDDV